MLILGTMNFGRRTPAPEAERIIARALERGITRFDTANVYQDGASERILGAALRGHGVTVEVATKVGLDHPGGKTEGLAPDRILAAFDRSAERLGMSSVDLYYLHAPDASVPIDETLSAIATLLASGKIRRWAVSNYSSWQLLELIALCDRIGLARPVASQVVYNLLIREIEIEHLRFTTKYGVEAIVYNALAGGLLSDVRHALERIQPGSRFDGNKMYQRRYWTPRTFELVEAFRAVAAEEGLALADLAYAWLAHRPGVGAVLLGPATVAQLDAAVDAAPRELRPTAVARLAELHQAHHGTDTHYAR